jgi:hypothetical protein
MKISFDEKEYNFIEIRRDDITSKIIISLSVQDAVNPRKTITNSVDMTDAEFLQLISDLDLI